MSLSISTLLSEINKEPQPKVTLIRYREDLYNLFLNGFDDTERQEYNCRICRNLINGIGRYALIVDGEVRSLIFNQLPLAEEIIGGSYIERDFITPLTNVLRVFENVTPETFELVSAEMVSKMKPFNSEEEDGGYHHFYIDPLAVKCTELRAALTTVAKPNYMLGLEENFDHHVMKTKEIIQNAYQMTPAIRKMFLDLKSMTEVTGVQFFTKTEREEYIPKLLSLLDEINEGDVNLLCFTIDLSFYQAPFFKEFLTKENPDTLMSETLYLRAPFKFTPELDDRPDQQFDDLANQFKAHFGSYYHPLMLAMRMATKQDFSNFDFSWERFDYPKEEKVPHQPIMETISIHGLGAQLKEWVKRGELREITLGGRERLVGVAICPATHNTPILITGNQPYFAIYDGFFDERELDSLFELETPTAFAHGLTFSKTDSDVDAIGLVYTDVLWKKSLDMTPYFEDDIMEEYKEYAPYICSWGLHHGVSANPKQDRYVHYPDSVITQTVAVGNGVVVHTTHGIYYFDVTSIR